MKNVATTTTGILIGGNKSTGIRTRLVTPTTQVMRQMTMMRYGRRMAKRDMKMKWAYDRFGAMAARNFSSEKSFTRQSAINSCSCAMIFATAVGIFPAMSDGMD